MSQKKLWGYLQKAKDISLCPLIGIFRLARLMLVFIWLLLKLIWSLVKKCFNRLFPQKQVNNQDEKKKTKDQTDKVQPKTIWSKLKQLNLSDVEQLMTDKIKSLEQHIPRFLSKWFPKYVKFDNSKLKVLTLEELKNSSNQVLVDIKKSTEKDTKLDLKKNSKISKIKQTRVYYVPTYLRVKVKNFTAIDLDKLQAQVNVDVIISFVYGNDKLIKIPRQVAVRLLNQVVLNFQRDDSLKLDQTDNVHISTKEQKQKYHIQFTVRKKLHMRIKSRVYYTPFQQLYLVLPITIQQLTPKTVTTQQLNPLTGKIQQTTFQASIKFNYMDNQGHFIKLDFTDEKHFGYYSLIETGLVAKYSNKRITSIVELEKEGEKKEEKKDKEEKQFKLEKSQSDKNVKVQQSSEQSLPLINQSVTKEKTSKKGKKKQQQSAQKEQTKASSKLTTQEPKQKSKQQKPKDSKGTKGQKQQLKNFQYSYFKIPIYKHPMASLVMIFLPLWSLAIINLGIFFQQNSLSQRIASIASLMIAFIALNETIRSQIPPHPKVVFVQLLVYAQMIACFLCLVNSYQVSQIENYKMQWTECQMFIISLGIFVSEVIIIFVMGMYHYYVMVPSYELADSKPKFDKIDTRNWSNKECDQHFDGLIKKTSEALATHKGLTQSKKLKDINEELMKKSQKPSQKVDSQETVLQVLKSLTQSLRKTQAPPGSQSSKSKNIQQKNFIKQKPKQEEKPKFKQTLSGQQN